MVRGPMVGPMVVWGPMEGLGGHEDLEERRGLGMPRLALVPLPRAEEREAHLPYTASTRRVSNGVGGASVYAGREEKERERLRRTLPQLYKLGLNRTVPPPVVWRLTLGATLG
jgi:hypothetical protein